STEARRCGDKDRNRIRIVLRPSDQIRDDEFRVAARCEYDRLGRTRQEIDCAVGAYEPLRGGDEAITGSVDLIDARNRARPVRERRYGLRAAHSCDRS